MGGEERLSPSTDPRSQEVLRMLYVLGMVSPLTMVSSLTSPLSWANLYYFLSFRWSLSGSSQAYLSYDWCKVFPSPFKVIGSEKFRAHAQ